MNGNFDYSLLGSRDMGRVDADAAASGILGLRLMQNAGEAIAADALKAWPGARRFIVLAGPGNNGGDGYVAAAALRRAAAETIVFALGEAGLKGDALAARLHWAAAVHPLEAYRPEEGDVIVDALFGAGLNKEVPAEVAAVIAMVTEAELPVIAADVPSGVDGESGEVRGAAFRATRTVTFMCRKPGHLLLPAREYCGEVSVFDIGIPKRFVAGRLTGLMENAPALWLARLPLAGAQSHKYSRGHLGVFSGGPTSSGAARLSAAAGLRAGAGAVTLVSPGAALAVNAGHLTAVMLKERTPEVVDALLSDSRVTAFVIGPGFGADEELRTLALKLAAKPIVLDADALTALAIDAHASFANLKNIEARAVMTPHEGEFRRLFPDIATEPASKVLKARRAAERSGSVVVYKGADTVVAAPDGRAVINANAPPWLATAGSGDVLSGITGALLAQGMPEFEAACAAAWIHGEAGNIAGIGLTAETLVDAVAQVFAGPLDDVRVFPAGG